MPAVTVSDITILPRISDTTGLRARRVKSVTTAPQGFEGEGVFEFAVFLKSEGFVSRYFRVCGYDHQFVCLGFCDHDCDCIFGCSADSIAFEFDSKAVGIGEDWGKESAIGLGQKR